MTRTLHAIILKELRENLPWAGIVFLIATGVHFSIFYVNIDRGTPLLDKQVFISCYMMYPVVGLSLGVLQIFFDFRVGRWQFLSHRPISRNQWFCGKILAGLILYCSAALLPLGLLTCWASIPRVMPGPFAIDMIEPALSIGISGLMWYAAGLLIAARSARWYGSRIMPLSLPLIGKFAAYGLAMTFAQAMLIYAAFTGIILLGACSAFSAGGESRTLRWWGRPTIALGVIAGWGMAINFLMLGTGELIDRYAMRGPNAAAVVEDERSWQLGADGEIVSQVDYRFSKAAGQDRQEYFDIAGKPTELPHGLLEQTDVNLRDSDSSDWSRTTRVMLQGFMAERSHVSTLFFGNDELWIYVAGRHLIEGYSRDTHRFIGSLGPDGFASPGQPCRPFDGPLQDHTNETMLTFGNDVFYVDIGRREVRHVFKPTSADVVCGAGMFLSRSHGAVYVVATKDRVHFLHNNGEFASVPLAIKPSFYLTTGVTTDGRIIIADGFNRFYYASAATELVYNTRGNLLTRADLPHKDAWNNYPDFRLLQKWEERAAFAIAPPAFFLALLTLRSYQWHEVLASPILESVVVAVLFAAISFGRLRRREIRHWRLWTWTLLSGLMGSTSLFVIPSVITSFASVPCRSCGKRRFVNEAICNNCGTAAEPPPMEGIEVFETATA